MLRRLFDMFKDDYLIEYNQYKEIINQLIRMN